MSRGLRRLLYVALSIELLGIGLVSVGLAYEVQYQAHAGLIAITAGSVFVAAGGIVWGKFARLLPSNSDDGKD